MPKTEEIKRICAWCNKVMGMKIVELIENEFQGQPTNGICRECLENQQEEMREYARIRQITGGDVHASNGIVSGNDQKEPGTSHVHIAGYSNTTYQQAKGRGPARNLDNTNKIG